MANKRKPDHDLQPNQPDENKPIKKRGRGGKYNFPSTIDPDTEDKDKIRAVLSDTLHWFELGVEHKANTDEEIFQRTKDYIEHCINTGIRPTVEAYCLSLGYPRQTVNAWKNGIQASTTRHDIIKKAFDTFATFDAGMVNNGDLNPVLYFFRAKNYYDMRDQQDLVITPNNQLSDISVDEVGKKYKELPQD